MSVRTESIVPKGTLDVKTLAIETITGNESAPSTASHGIDCAGFTHVSVSFYTLSVTNYSIELWVYNGSGWAQASDSAGAVIDINTITTTWANTYLIAGFQRVAMRLNTSTSLTSIKRIYALHGPGV